MGERISMYLISHHGELLANWRTVGECQIGMLAADQAEVDAAAVFPPMHDMLLINAKDEFTIAALIPT